MFAGLSSAMSTYDILNELYSVFSYVDQQMSGRQHQLFLPERENTPVFA
jgi:hypothetical protein